MRHHLLLPVVMVALLAPAAHGEVTNKEIDAAIGRIQKHLYLQQDEDGGWDSSLRGHAERFTTGNTAIVTLALLESGQTLDHPRLARAVNYLKANKGDGIYAVALRTHVWATLGREYMIELERELGWLRSCERMSMFDYFPPKQRDPDLRPGRIDHSATQYGTLAFADYVAVGGHVPQDFWDNSIAHFLEFQHRDGGWDYSTGGRANSYGSMTAAGLNALLAGRRFGRRQVAKPDPKLVESIDAGTRWLDKNFGNGDTNPEKGGHLMYYLHSLARVADQSGLSRLNNKDLYRAGAKTILDRLRGGGTVGNNSDTAYALIFLARARLPVVVQKLALPDHPWNERPNDVYFLSHRYGRETSRKLRWRNVSIDTPSDQWQDAPVTILCAAGKFTLTPEQLVNLAAYLKAGGTLVVIKRIGAKHVEASTKALAAAIYPELKLDAAAKDHPLYKGFEKASTQPFDVVFNGKRDVIYLMHKDWSQDFQRTDPPGRGAAWKLAFKLLSDIEKSRQQREE